MAGNPLNNKSTPSSHKVIVSMLKEIGIADYDPKVVNQLLEITYRYVTCILDDARVYANHAKKKTLDQDDVKLAIGMQLDRVFTTPPPREILLEIARSKNSIPLPPVKPHCGIRLPPDRFCLNSANYRLKSAAPTKKTKNYLHQSSILPSPQSTIKIGAKSSQMAVMKRPSTITTVPRTQSITAPKAVIKFSSPHMNSGSQKIQVKPMIQIGTSQPSASQQFDVVGQTVKIDFEDSSLKRKREDDGSSSFGSYESKM